MFTFLFQLLVCEFFLFSFFYWPLRRCANIYCGDLQRLVNRLDDNKKTNEAGLWGDKLQEGSLVSQRKYLNFLGIFGDDC